MRMTYPTGGVACLDPSRFEDIERRIVLFRGPIVPRVIDVEIVTTRWARQPDMGNVS